MDENKIILYTIHCPNCNVLEKKMLMKNISFEICDSMDEMQKLDIKSAPMLKVNEELMPFRQALQWVNQYGNNT